MNRRTTFVLAVFATALVTFGGAAYYVMQEKRAAVPATRPIDGTDHLVRPHSPVIGPTGAQVTIVEFFDPACESCRAFHPVVKEILGRYPGKVRVVIRYAAFHPGSAEAIRILETARLQDRFLPVLEALLAAQPTWASHRFPNTELAWDAAAGAGLDVERARRERLMPHIAAALNFDAADIAALGIRGTPTFFVNGRPLAEFGADQLRALVRDEVTRY